MIPLKEKIGYGLGDMASSMFWKLFGAYLMIFYTDVFGLPAAIVGTMFLITRIWDSFFDPVVGVIADRTNSRWGKFRPYLLWLAVPFGVIGILTFYTPDFPLTGKIIFAYTTYSLMMMVYSAINVPYASLLGVMSPHPEDRNVLSAFRMAFAYVGSFIALLLFMPLANGFSARVGGETSEQIGWMLAAAVIAAMCVALFLGCFALTKERVGTTAGRSSIQEDLRDLWHNRPWWILLGAGIAALLFNSIRDGAAVYYFKYYLLEAQFSEVSFCGITFVMSGLYLAAGQVANIVGVILAAPVSNRIGKKHTFMSAMTIAALLSIAFFWLSRENPVLIFLFQIVISICAGAIFPILWSMYADCTDYSELKTGNRATGLIFSSSSMSQKIGWALGTAVTGWLLGYFGFEANQVQEGSTLTGIKLFLSFLPAIGAMLSVVFIGFYPLSEQKMKAIEKKLMVKKGAAND